ncbi:hypothetical protein NC653_040414 [Populus alba x Populus x berolinensis]|uniref:Uncharacterized protein n=1 Tax=Populus alba x Populus x berolinensis TaxID=444605 RepID=A0AAD6PSL2_9ROSI|nr:hypothetical protein NC653_040409 [Populus alba x Populus x berolinensis]KAJ6958779.1 hypothetical protein NC653_040414 [Populus alba x Populus x berolinensis]
MIRFNLAKTHQPTTQHPSTSAPHYLQIKTAVDSSISAKPISQPVGHIQKTSSKISGSQQSSKEKPKQPNYKKAVEQLGKS